MTGSIFVSDYTMETIKADTAMVDHAKMNRRYLALMRLARIKNNRVFRDERPGGFW